MDDEVVGADEGEGGVVGVVQPLAADLRMQIRDFRGGLPPAAAAAFLACKLPLGRRACM